jgi:hypothetical protein
MLNPHESEIFSLCLLLSIVLYYNSLRDNRKITRSAILLPKFSPSWKRLLNFEDDKSFLVLTGFSRNSFFILEQS